MVRLSAAAAIDQMPGLTATTIKQIVRLLAFATDFNAMPTGGQPRANARIDGKINARGASKINAGVAGNYHKANSGITGDHHRANAKIAGECHRATARVTGNYHKTAGLLTITTDQPPGLPAATF